MSKLWIFILWLLITASTPFLPTPETTSSPQLDNLPLQRVTTERATPQAGLPPTSCTPYLVALGYETAVYQDRFLFAASTDNTVTIWHYGQNFTDDKIV